MNHRTAIATGLVLSTLMLPAQAQLDDPEQGDEPQQRQGLEEQAHRAILELFQDLELDLDDADVDDPRQRILEERERLREIQQRLIELRQGQQRNPGFVQLEQAAAPVQLDPKVYTNPFAERSREETIAALDHQDFAVRQSAEAHLLTDETLNKEVLKALIQEAKSPEQHQRLLRVAEHHVLRELRERDFSNVEEPGENDEPVPFRRANRPASIGYSYEPVMARENPHAPLAGVRVIATMPGFPGHAHLRQGDIIVQIAGQGLNQNHQHHDITSWVRWRIAAHQAGDKMSMMLLRDGELLTVEMVCAQGLALDHMYTTDAFETAARKAPYKQAWERARDELIAELPKPKMLTPKAIELGE